jgi:hypothetical protein
MLLLHFLKEPACRNKPVNCALQVSRLFNL